MAIRSLVVAVDVDEVIADLLGPWLRRYNAKYDDALLPEDLKEWKMAPGLKPECGDDIFSLLDASLYDEVLPIPGARTAIYEMLSSGHRVIYVTSCLAGTADAKLAWLKRWRFLPNERQSRDFYASSDKSLINADVLFDDGIHNVEAFPRPAVLVEQPQNRLVPCWRPRIRALSEWREGLTRAFAFHPSLDA